MNNIIENLKNRRTIRTYADRAVERAVMEEIVDCGRLAPTAMNDQPWEFVVVTDKNELARIPKMLGHAEFLANAAFCVRLVCPLPSAFIT